MGYGSYRLNVEYKEVINQTIDVYAHEITASDYKQTIRSTNPTRISSPILLGSILFNLFIFFLILGNIEIPSSINEKRESSIVQAILFSEILPQRTENKKTKDTLHLAPMVENQEKQAQSPSIKQPSKYDPPIVESESLLSTPEESVITPRKNNIMKNETTDLVSGKFVETPKTFSSIESSLFDSVAKKQLLELEKSKDSALAGQAYDEFYYNKNHPKISAPIKAKTSFEDQVMESIQREIDCSSASGKTLSLVSGLLYNTALGDGPVRCQKPANIDYFINKRLERLKLKD